ncbi:MAG TPA: PfkB family carbohydrate kinase [Methylomirabilota bacterium]|nr:PfkB family carbohydrate kinase [Methylomirabilota bacterium]
MPAPDFVAIGHVTLDHFGEVTRPGGAALYAAITAHRLGLSVGLLTSHGPDFPLDELPTRIEVVGLPAPATTSFDHASTDAGRMLRARNVAQRLTVEDLPPDWRDAPLVLLAPVLQEVDPRLAAAFPDGAVGAALQGWLRRVEKDGTVAPVQWPSPDAVLGHLQSIFVSAADVRGGEAQVIEWVQRVPFAVVTAGAAGALLYVNGDRYEVRPRRTREVDPTGAGDVFAAAFLVHYDRVGDAWEAAEAASCAASLAVEGRGWSSVPDAGALAAALHAYRARAR